MFIYYRVGNKMQAIFDTYILSNIIVVETSRFVSSSFRLGGKKRCLRMPLQDGDERHVAQENLGVKARDARVPNQKVINYKMVLVRLCRANVDE